MSNNYAVINDNVVTSIIVWDGVAQIDMGGVELVPVGEECIVGSSYLGGDFTYPAPPEKTYAELVAQADSQKAALRTQADAVIAPLQDATDLGMATPEETAQLTEWKTYRVQLNRVDTSTAPDITWPDTPA